jgi:VWFA-related protein
MITPRQRATALLMFALPMLPLAAAGQDSPAEPPAEQFTGQAEVVSVEVPVQVVGRDGRPIAGLTAANFELLDEGKPQTLTGFDVYDLGETAITVESGPIDQPDIPSSARRHILLLFDLSFASPTSIVKARRAARDFVLSSLHPTDLAGVATYTLEQGPRLIVTFTPDRAQLARGIDTLGARTPADRLFERDPLRFVIAPPSMTDFGLASDMGSGDADTVRAQRDQAILDHMRVIAHAADRSERQYAEARMAGYSRGLAELARSLHSVAGRKQIVYFSEGFDSRLMLGQEPGSDEANLMSQDLLNGRLWLADTERLWGSSEIQNDLHRMLEEFRRADCAIQAIDIGGLRSTTTAAADGARD